MATVRMFGPMASFVRDYRIVLGEPFPLPMCDLFLLGPKGRARVQTVVDSGAFRPIFPLKAAEDSGIDVSRGWPCPVEYGGAGSAGRLVQVRLELEGDGPTLDTSVVFAERLDLSYALLGRVGFFDRFNEVAFLHRKAKTPRYELRY